MHGNEGDKNAHLRRFNCFSVTFTGCSNIWFGFIPTMMAVPYVQNLRTTYLAPSTVPYQRTVLQFNFWSVPYQRTVPAPLQKRRTVPTYRTRTNTKKAYRTAPTYRTVPYCHPCIPKLDFSFCCSVNKYHFIELAAFHTYEITYHELQKLKNKQVTYKNAVVESSRTSLASKMKFLALASNPASPRKCSILGSRTALCFDLFKMC